MQQAANAVTPLQALLGDYPGHAGHDELLDADRQPRAHWQGLLDDIAALGADTLVARSEEAQNLLHENGVTFNPYEDDPGQLRSWQLDCVPWVISTEEWELLEAGLKQRSRLLEQAINTTTNHDESTFGATNDGGPHHHYLWKCRVWCVCVVGQPHV